MKAWSFSRLLQFVNRQLDLDSYMKVCDHLKCCDICHDAVCQLLRDRDESSFIYRAGHEIIHRPTPYQRRTTVSGRVKMSTIAPAVAIARFRLKSASLNDGHETMVPFGPGSRHTIGRI
jgi:hypothetical protein